MNEKITVKMVLGIAWNKKRLFGEIYFGTFLAPKVAKKVIEYYRRKKSKKTRYLKVAGFAFHGVLRINRLIMISWESGRSINSPLQIPYRLS